MLLVSVMWWSSMAQFGRDFAPPLWSPPHGIAPNAHQGGSLTAEQAISIARFDPSRVATLADQARLDNSSMRA
jgi:hypothetical protein